ncbi:MAG: hypothetical protein ACREPP_07960 [Rhodanobacteraceae bacterium]
MPQNDPQPTDPKRTSRRVEEQANSAMKALGNLLEHLTPTLFEAGSWVFGGLIASNLVVIASLITVGPVAVAILVAVTAHACALPLNVAGICLLRLIKHVKEIGIEDLALKAFRDAEFPDIDAYFPALRDRDVISRRRSVIALAYSLGIAALGTLLTVTGLVAALWYMAWWVGAALLAMIIVSTLLVVVVLAHSMTTPSEAGKT